MTVYKHMMIVEDGENVENSLHLTEHDRALRLIAIVEGDEIGDGYISEVIEDGLDGEEPPADPEEYFALLRELLSENGIDVHLDDLEAPAEKDEHAGWSNP
ncbi:hypothetical protein ACFVU2_19720 [Leifsonia sp. NPDC058194]|uniref:hypothetical protein n=1 Tax=Leifsonia sp. NPDC058194 TaxID=3346374 RepID=UPI0036D917E1